MHLAYRDERLFVARFVIGLNRELYRSLFPARADFAGRLDALMVACAVTIGHAEGRPMGATKIAAYLELPRTTVLRRLAELIAAGAIARDGTRYVVSASRMEAVNTETFRRIIRLFKAVRAADDGSALF